MYQAAKAVMQTRARVAAGLSSGRERSGGKWLRWATMLLILLLGPDDSAAAMRCGSGLVSEGDRAYDLLVVCGKPDYRQQIAGAYLPGVGVLVEEERWYYNFGPQRLLWIARIRNGRVARLDTDGYGFSETIRGDCNPNLLSPGMNLLELLARCGEPAYVESRVEVIPPSPPDRPFYDLIPVEEWTYSFGPTRFTRILTIVGATVRRVDTGRRH